MKIILAALNAKYIHSTLALYYLKNFCLSLPDPCKIKEYTINEKVLDVAGDLHLEKAEIIGFSCYIWNIGPTLEICSILKKTNPEIFIVLGGPEVSYDPEAVLTDHPFIDCIVMGEGEETFYQLIDRKGRGLPWEDTVGLARRKNQQVVKNPARPLLACLERLPSPYTVHDLTHFAGKIIYYESSRGCPFHCQYCLSSTFSGVRYFPLDRVKDDLTKMIHAGVKQVKFVDRTFNCRRDRTKELLSFLLAYQDKKINFHFEMAADLLDEEIIALMGQAPPGFFQVEIGVQSTNPQVLEGLQRKMNFSQVQESVEKLKNRGNVHLHLDLIAGLPGEDIISLEKSFNEVYQLRPDHLQLGFLKLLKGSGLRNRAEELGLVFQDQPPYEILSTRDLSFHELVELKKIEDVLEQYYNSGRYKHTLREGIPRVGGGSFRFFRGLARFWAQEEQEKMLRAERKTKLLYRYLTELSPANQALFFDLLKLDWLSSEPRNTLPQWLGGGGEQDRKIDLAAYLPWAKGMTRKEIFKKAAVEEFHHYFVLEKDMIIGIEKRPGKAIIDYAQHGEKPVILFAKND